MILAVPLRTRTDPNMRPWDFQYYICDHYKIIFDRLGITLFPILSANCAEEVCRICDGLILAGTNKNIYPEYYGHTREPGANYSVDEYSIDKPIVEAFVKAGKPIIGICGGIQILNVYFGGTLKQKVSEHGLKDSTHTLSIKEGSFLHRVYGKDKIETNSYHGQAVDEVAPGFTVTAVAEDGTIEGMEKDNIIAVQWHPEVAYDMAFFRTFIETFLGNAYDRKA